VSDILSANSDKEDAEELMLEAIEEPEFKKFVESLHKLLLHV